MKKIAYMISAVVLILTTSLIACKDDDDPSALEIETNKITDNWVINGDAAAVTLDDYDVSGSFEGFEVVIKSDKTFETIGSPDADLWPTSGTWTFLKNSDGSFNFTKVIRNDGIEMQVMTITATQLILKFQFEAPSVNGKSDGVSAEYVFKFDVK